MTRATALAVLQAGDTETLYRRAGDGPPVLILCTGALAEPVGDLLFERLAARFRVVATTLPGGDGAADVLAIWLGEVIEGLGLARPSLVLDHALARALLEGAVLGPGAVAGVVAVRAASGRDGEADRDDPLGGLARRDVLLVALIAGDVDAAAAAMTPFLAGGWRRDDR